MKFGITTPIVLVEEDFKDWAYLFGIYPSSSMAFFIFSLVFSLTEPLFKYLEIVDFENPVFLAMSLWAWFS